MLLQTRRLDEIAGAGAVVPPATPAAPAMPRRANTPHKRPPLVRSHFILLRSGEGLVLLLVLSWCVAVERLGGGIFSRHSRFFGFHSRLGQHEFPVRAATGIGRKRLDLTGCFHEENRARLPKIGEIPGFTGKNREFSVAKGADLQPAAGAGALWLQVLLQTRHQLDKVAGTEPVVELVHEDSLPGVAAGAG